MAQRIALVCLEESLDALDALVRSAAVAPPLAPVLVVDDGISESEAIN